MMRIGIIGIVILAIVLGIAWAIKNDDTEL